MARPLSSTFLLLSFLLVPVLFAGCSEPPAAAARPNVLHDAGFEEGGRDWGWIPSSPVWLHDFAIADEGRSGNRSLLLQLEDAEGKDVGIVGAIQNLTFREVGGSVPKSLSGWYRVDRWENGAEKTYLQVVMGLQPREGSREPVCPYASSSPDAFTAPCQLAYVLGGVDRAPFEIANRKFVFLDRDEPETGEWVRFEASPRKDYDREWGLVPGGFTQLKFYVETRYEFEEGEERSPVNVTVRWDDLYLG
jgi:hypothetical protein